VFLYSEHVGPVVTLYTVIKYSNISMDLLAGKDAVEKRIISLDLPQSSNLAEPLYRLSFSG
jgi:hypothetical protein